MARSIAQPMRHFREKIGCRRRNDDQIRLARKPDMADLGFVLEVEQLREGGLFRKHGDGKRRNELLRGGGQDAADPWRRAP